MSSETTNPSDDHGESWSPMRLMVLGFITLMLALAAIYIASAIIGE